MARYFNQVSDVTSKKVGRSLSGRDFGQAKYQLHPGEHLYALCDRLIFKQVVCVDDRADFDNFHGQYMAGHLISFELIALTEKQHKNTS